jgi:hypothetical protein
MQNVTLESQIKLLELNLNAYAALAASSSSDVSFTYYRELQKTLKLLKRYKAYEYLLNKEKKDAA